MIKKSVLRRHYKRVTASVFFHPLARLLSEDSRSRLRVRLRVGLRVRPGVRLLVLQLVIALVIDESGTQEFRKRHGKADVVVGSAVLSRCGCGPASGGFKTRSKTTSKIAGEELRVRLRVRPGVRLLVLQLVIALVIDESGAQGFRNREGKTDDVAGSAVLSRFIFATLPAMPLRNLTHSLARSLLSSSVSFHPLAPSFRRIEDYEQDHE